jgi:hypothetical protein
MRVVWLRAPGGPGQLAVEEAGRPRPRAGPGARAGARGAAANLHEIAPELAITCVPLEDLQH